MRVLAWDTWAFIEVALERPRAREVTEAMAGVELVVTSRDVIVETFNFMVAKARSTAPAWQWLESITASRIRVYDAPLAELQAFVRATRREGGLSLTDYSLARVAKEQGATAIATADRDFRRLGLEPLFAPT